MLHKPPDPQFSRQDPWGEDDLQRREFCEAILRFIQPLTQPFAIALEAPWGAGKTNVLRRLECELEGGQHGMLCARFDAWMNEGHADPLVGVSGAVADTLQRHSAPNNRLEAEARGIRDKLQSMAKSFGRLLLVPGAAGIASAIESSLPGAGALTGAALVAAGSAATVGAETAVEKLEAQADPARLAEEFMEQLSSAVASIRNAHSEGGCKLLVVVDELDRCRPDYTIRVLERLKHFYAVPGVVFLIAVDSAYLRSAVCAIYGNKFDAVRYLRRFIEFAIRLPQPTPEQMSKALWRRFEFASIWPKGESGQSEFCEIVSPLLRVLGLSLRDTEQAIMRYRLSLVSACPSILSRLALNAVLSSIKWPDLALEGNGSNPTLLGSLRAEFIRLGDTSNEAWIEAAEYAMEHDAAEVRSYASRVRDMGAHKSGSERAAASVKLGALVDFAAAIEREGMLADQLRRLVDGSLLS